MPPRGANLAVVDRDNGWVDACLLPAVVASLPSILNGGYMAELKEKIHWELYDSMKGSAIANHNLTVALNSRLKKVIALGPEFSREHAAKQVQKEMLEIMDKYRKLGANDTEPQCVLAHEINRALGTDIDRW